MTEKTTEVDHRKPCTLCDKPRDVLVRCQIDETGRWHFVCPGSCWQKVSGGKVDGDGAEQHKWYRYGGMWKNKHEAVSAKKPKKPKEKKQKDINHAAEHSDSHDDASLSVTSVEGLREWLEEEHAYAKNDKVIWNDRIWTCRKSHVSIPGKTPAENYNAWKEVD